MARRPSLVREIRRARHRWIRAWQIYMYPYLVLAVVVLCLVVFALLQRRPTP
jgi:t-SNARE complex subunit (syntaxin)